jgi:HEXXH motif-containing protein
MTKLHSISDKTFFDIASGGGDVDAVRVLKDIEFSKHLMLIRAVIELANRVAHEQCRRAGTDEAFALLSAAWRQDPIGTRQILSRPQVGSWARRCLVLLRRGHAGVELAIDLAYLGSVAAAASIRAGIAGHVIVGARNTRVCIPAYGIAVIEPDCSWPLIAIKTPSEAGGAPNIYWPPGCRQVDWLPMRVLSASSRNCELSAEFDDLDPYRGYDGLEAHFRVDDHEFERWQSRLRNAWERLVDRHLPSAEAISSGLRSIVPLRDPADGTETSATSRSAFGATLLSLPRTPLTFAIALVHEFQHAKLGAIIDLLPLCKPDRHLHYSPWRDEMRPIGALLQAAYAFLGVADFWRAERTYDHTRSSERRETKTRKDVFDACERLLRSGSLTSAGEHFVAIMRDASSFGTLS